MQGGLGMIPFVILLQRRQRDLGGEEWREHLLMLKLSFYQQ